MIDRLESKLQEAEKELDGDKEEIDVFKERLNKAKEVCQLVEGLLGVILAKSRI